ncbi:MAG: glycosyltransferase [Candidatus Dormibacteraeota bacterium]|nr:glycosyltransferase [Candidatus Dormibacteraeota bacterium]
MHDYLVTMGGAERVFLSIARAFPEAPIYTSIFRPDTALPEFRSMEVRPLWSNRLPLTEANYRAGVMAFAASFDRLRLAGYDVVISSSSAFAKNAGRDARRRIWYCYTPPRFIWPCGESSHPAGPLERAALMPATGALRRWDRQVAGRSDRILAISSEVRDRVRRFYGMDAEVLHPPVWNDVNGMRTDDDPRRGYLVVSRLNRYKAIDVAIEACREAGAPLSIIGRGSDEARLRALAGDTVTFRGRVTDEELHHAYRGAEAVLLPGEEDWGMTPLEANAHGTPAIAAARGGALETVIDGTTGVLYRPYGYRDLALAMGRASATSFSAARLREHAAGFGEKAFQDTLARHVAEVAGA